MNEVIDLEQVQEENINLEPHIPSKLQADTLFTFCNRLDFLISPLKSKMISARYCEENIEYLNIKNIKKICFPMKCFCDINLHRISEHLSWYGYYGLAFTKSWGMNKGIHPLHYFNKNSPLSKEFSDIFNKSILIDKKTQTKNEMEMKNFLAHYLMYCKPYSGVFKSRQDEKNNEKCYMDECEWRFVPNVSKINYKQIYINEEILNKGTKYFQELSDSMMNDPNTSISFEYEDLKYIIVKDRSDFERLIDEIEKFDISKLEKKYLISKIIVWELSGGDF